MLGPVLLWVVPITVIRAFFEFERMAVLISGAPVKARQMLLFTVYEKYFRYFKVDMASTITVMFLAVVATVSIVQALLLDRRLHNV